MAARQFRWLLLGELLFYLVLGTVLVSGAGWTPLRAAGFALAWFFGVRALIVALTFLLMLRGRGVVPPELRIGFFGTLRMVLEEYLGFVVLFSLIQPFESFWLGPDRLAHCAARRTPLLLIHGYQCNRGFWFQLRGRIARAGWQVGTISLAPVFNDIDGYVEQLARRIDEVCEAAGTDRLLLVGHSMGGLVSRAYLRRHGNGKVAKLVTLGSPHHGSRLAVMGPGRNARQMIPGSEWLAGLNAPGAVPLPAATVSIYSCQDNYVMPQDSPVLEGAKVVPLAGIGHLEMAFSPEIERVLLAELSAT